MNDESLSELQREWRKRITDDIAELRTLMSALVKELSEQRDEYVTQREHDDHEQRLKKLEADRQKFTGAVIILNVIGGFALWVIGKFWK